MSLVEGKTAKKFGRNLARKNFTIEELKDRRTNPRKSTSLASLDGEKLQEIKELIEGRFPGEFMQACDGIDDLGRDIKKDNIRKSKKLLMEMIVVADREQSKNGYRCLI